MMATDNNKRQQVTNSDVFERMSSPSIWPPRFEIKKSLFNEKTNESHLPVATSYCTPGDPNFFFQRQNIKNKTVRTTIRYFRLDRLAFAFIKSYLLLYYYVRYGVFENCVQNSIYLLFPPLPDSPPLIHSL